MGTTIGKKLCEGDQDAWEKRYLQQISVERRKFLPNDTSAQILLTQQIIEKHLETKGASLGTLKKMYEEGLRQITLKSGRLVKMIPLLQQFAYLRFNALKASFSSVIREEDISVQIETFFRNKEFYNGVEAQLLDDDHVVNKVAHVLHRNIPILYACEEGSIDYEHVFHSQVLPQIKFIRDIIKEIIQTLYDSLFRYNLLERTKDLGTLPECLANKCIFREIPSNKAFFSTMFAIRDRIYYEKRHSYEANFTKKQLAPPLRKMKRVRSSDEAVTADGPPIDVAELIRSRFRKAVNIWDPWDKFYLIRSVYPEVSLALRYNSGKPYSEAEEIEAALLEIIYASENAMMLFDFEWIDALLHDDVVSHPMNLRFSQIRLYFLNAFKLE